MPINWWFQVGTTENTKTMILPEGFIAFPNSLSSSVRIDYDSAINILLDLHKLNFIIIYIYSFIEQIAISNYSK